MINLFHINTMVIGITRYEKVKLSYLFKKKDSLSAEEEVLFDCNVLAKGFLFSVGGINISPDNRYVAFGIDTLSRRKYKLQVKDLKTGVITF